MDSFVDRKGNHEFVVIIYPKLIAVLLNGSMEQMAMHQCLKLSEIQELLFSLN